MTFVGKIFVVLILVMSLVFMSLSVMVFATHTNWRDEVVNPTTGFKKQLQDARAQLADAQSRRLKLETELANEKSARLREVSKLTTEVTELTREKNTLQAKEAALVESERSSVAAMNATQATLAKLREEIDTLRTANADARKERDTALANSVQLEDQMAQAKGELDRLKGRNTQLAEQVAQQGLALQHNGIQLDTAGPPPVEGVVLAATDDGLIEMSIGFDDGLQTGQSLQAYRLGADEATTKYLGEVTVVRVEADRAVARVVPERRQGKIQVGDRVATRLESVARKNLVPNTRGG
jgi:small-conductance mechanosensitive channel